MAKSKTMKKKSYTRYSEAYRQEALAWAGRIGVAADARELNFHSSQLYQWRPNAQLKQDASKRERSLAAGSVRLKRRLADTNEISCVTRPEAGGHLFSSKFPVHCIESFVFKTKRPSGHLQPKSTVAGYDKNQGYEIP